MTGCQKVTFHHSFLFPVVGSATEPLNTRGKLLFLLCKCLPQGKFQLVDAVKRPHKVTHFSLESLHFSPVFRGKRVEDMYSWFVNEGKNVSCGRERDRCLLVLLLILNSRQRGVQVLFVKQQIAALILQKLTNLQTYELTLRI